MKLSIRKWTKRFSVSYSRERTGFMTYRATFTRAGRRLIIPNLVVPFGPSMREALAGKARSAKIAAPFGGEYPAWRAQQSGLYGEQEYRARYAPHQRDYLDLVNGLGGDCAWSLLWDVSP